MTKTKKPTAAEIAPAPEVVAEETVTSIKGYDRTLKCRDFQYEIGKTYEHKGTVIACKGGFHAIGGYPLEVFDYYAPGESRYTEVHQSGTLAKHDADSKIASAKITIGIELSLSDLVTRAVKWVIGQTTDAGSNHAEGYRSAASSTGDQSAASSTGDRTAASSTGDQSAASSTGYQSAASSTGDRSAASSTGDQSAASSTGDRTAASSTGYQSAASSTGDQSAASSTGDQSAASSTGDRTAASSTGDQSAASSTGYQSAASSTGDRSAASSTGDQSAASSTGDQSAASSTGYQSAAMSAGREGRAMAAKGSALFLVYRDDRWNIVHAWAGIAGRDGIKPLVWYSLDESGKPVEVDAS